ncbi:interleukin-17 receptor E isoform X2 [Periophthalmus magnuspinnatus]|uniref:interleukin-17 receptor E isoform X2 n=1 Tax=Periophthalmus magnuspinnatus TaxID=409849 RepID=UPI0024374124|nr:interleukin-17 receptor E isoform X2 [Periophthalmus magnuspinnatus]
MWEAERIVFFFHLTERIFNLCSCNDGVKMRLGSTTAFTVVFFLFLDCPALTGQSWCLPVAMAMGMYSLRTGAGLRQFNFTLNESLKSVTVYVEPGPKVSARPLYKRSISPYSDAGSRVWIDPAVSQSAVLKVTYWLTCLCVEIYCTGDKTRHVKCPLANSVVPDVNDIWRSTKFKLESNVLAMVLKCPTSETEMSTALCWKHNGYCTVVFDLSLVEQLYELKRYNISAVDKHPQMCLLRSLNGSQNITCHFKSGMSSWMVNTELMRQGIFVYINSTVPAKFSAQLCKLNQTTCASMGQIHSLNTKQRVATFHLSVLSAEERPCVQVWQSEPVLYGKRIMCFDYTRTRYGLYVAMAIVCVVIMIVLGVCFHWLTKKGTAGWLHVPRPILLVCSSEDSVHVSTACALASILQGDLGAIVHLALWAQSVQSQCGMRVADVGPLPWLYGQWDTVIEAQGIILIMWSLDAKIAYKKWCSEKKSIKSSHQKDFISHRPHKTENSPILTEKCKFKVESHAAQRPDVSKPCTVIAPVFKAALTCLMGMLQENKPQKVVFVSLHGHNNSKDIPKAFRGIPRFCLPHQFSGLIQELGVQTRLSENSRFHCWPRLLSKVLCFWLAKQLAKRLQATLQ